MPAYLLGLFQAVPLIRLTISGKRKGVWIGQSLERKLVAALGRAGLGCDRQILSQGRLPDHEDVGTRLPRKQPAREPYLANRARLNLSAGKLSRRLLSSAACGFNSSTLPPQSLNLGRKRISRYVFNSRAFSEPFITNSSFQSSHPPKSQDRSVGNTKLPRAKTLFGLSLKENPTLYRSSNIFYLFERRKAAQYFLPPW